MKNALRALRRAHGAHPLQGPQEGSFALRQRPFGESARDLRGMREEHDSHRRRTRPNLPRFAASSISARSGFAFAGQHFSISAFACARALADMLISRAASRGVLMC